MRKIYQQTFSPDLKLMYAAIQSQMAKLPAIYNLFGATRPEWFHCGEWYNRRGKARTCKRYAGHPGIHSQRTY